MRKNLFSPRAKLCPLKCPKRCLLIMTYYRIKVTNDSVVSLRKLFAGTNTYNPNPFSRVFHCCGDVVINFRFYHTPKKKHLDPCKIQRSSRTLDIYNTVLHAGQPSCSKNVRFLSDPETIFNKLHNSLEYYRSCMVS